MNTVVMLENFSNADLEIINRTIRITKCKLSYKQTLFEENDILDSFFIVSYGKFQSGHYKANGDYEINNYYWDNDIIGLDVINTSSRKAHFTVSAMKESVVTKISRDFFISESLPQAIKEKINLNALDVLAEASIKRDRYTWILHEKNMNNRILMFLSYMIEEKDSLVFDIEMSRFELAQFLGMNRTVLSHRLGLMQKKGILRFYKSHFEILDVTEISKFKF